LQKAAEEKLKTELEAKKSKTDLESKISALEVNLQVLGDLELCLLYMQLDLSNQNRQFSQF
jgi:hypothetical protein